MKKPVCPRCLNYIPNNDAPGAYPGAISRADDKTEICSYCGMEEAFEMFFDSKRPTKDNWPLKELKPREGNPIERGIGSTN